MTPTIRRIRPFDPFRIAKSGQAFRIRPLDDTHVELVAMGRYLQIAVLGDDRYVFSCSEDEFDSVWKGYFDLDTDYDGIIDSIDPSDSYLRDASAFGYGIRILRQELFETVISYIISQRRSIPAISTSVERICALAGEPIVPSAEGQYFVSPSASVFYSFPTPLQLIPHRDELCSCGLGYRLPYVVSAAEAFASGAYDDLLSLDDDSLIYSRLTSLTGVGVKVANCIMLFSLHRTGRFPVDVWISRIQDRCYGGRFPVEKYPGTAGILQQFMFYYERCDKLH